MLLSNKNLSSEKEILKYLCENKFSRVSRFSYVFGIEINDLVIKEKNYEDNTRIDG